MDIIQQLIDFLNQLANNPVSYSIIFYVYCILAAIILPIPVEIGLFMGDSVPFIIKALILGAGKATGSVLVFYIGAKVEGPVRFWSKKFNWFAWMVEKMELVVARLKYVGLYLILSIPLMVDTVPIYLWSIFNKEGKALSVGKFALTNMFAGFTRAIIVYLVFLAFGIQLV
ncbi:MAG: hypothetical protein LUO79_07395 [Methanomassiliicoccales archaeon]|nr:hypothetical protein [Methanomassiliicoccales archaeon]